jgi:hypothetical protein
MTENKQTDKEWNEYRQNISQGWDHVPHPTSKQQRQTALQQEIEQKLTGTNTTNIMNETNRMNMKIMNNIQTNNTNITWTETNRWIASVGIGSSIFGFIYWSYVNNLLFTLFLGCALGGLILFIKEIVDEVIYYK